MSHRDRTKTPKIRRSITFTVETLAKLDKLAIKLDRNRSETLRVIIEGLK